MPDNVPADAPRVERRWVVRYDDGSELDGWSEAEAKQAVADRAPRYGGETTYAAEAVPQWRYASDWVDGEPPDRAALERRLSVAVNSAVPLIGLDVQAITRAVLAELGPATGHLVTAGLGPCGFCPEPAVATVNGTGACVAHLDDAFAPVGDAVRRLRDLANGGGAIVAGGAPDPLEDAATAVLARLDRYVEEAGDDAHTGPVAARAELRAALGARRG